MQTKIIKLKQLFKKMLQFILSIHFYYDVSNCESYVMPRYDIYIYIYIYIYGYIIKASQYICHL